MLPQCSFHCPAGPPAAAAATEQQPVPPPCPPNPLPINPTAPPCPSPLPRLCHAERLEAPGLNRLRTARLLEEGQVITVEPGCYFCRVLLEPAFKDPVLGPFLVEERVRQFMVSCE